ncbi:hypothetical protein BASA81_008052 [Batrachochytrium salamandrivorans]|nr:hypothetical protein BASA81_008052 [Batrachochytrium salamandrivorans]
MSDNAGSVSSSSRTPLKSRSSSRVAKLSKRFSTNDASGVTVESPASTASMSRSNTAKRVIDHEVKMWLELNVTASRDF